MTLGQQLREARQKKNLTPSQVAAATRMKWSPAAFHKDLR